MKKINNDKLSKYISLVLRHKPEIAAVTLDEHGWANVDELLRGVNLSGRKIDMELLEEIVATDDKQRYSFNDDKTLIRVNQGHSVLVDVELEEKCPPDILYHGTAKRFVPSIQEKGILRMSRLYVHLSWSPDIAAYVGKRHGKPTVLIINAKKMYDAGIKFYFSENDVWLTEYVAPEYIGVPLSTALDDRKTKKYLERAGFLKNFVVSSIEPPS